MATGGDLKIRYTWPTEDRLPFCPNVRREDSVKNQIPKFTQGLQTEFFPKHGARFGARFCAFKGILKIRNH